MFGERLKSARRMSGLSLEDLAQRLGEITKQALNNYEQGKRKPDSAIIIKLAKALGVKPDYFFKESEIALTAFEYRKKARLTKKGKDIIEEKSKEELERYLELENILGITSNFENHLKDFKIRGIEDVEIAAEYLREKWELGLNPIKNLIETLEDHDIRVFQIDAKNEFDGLAGYSGMIPIIVMNKGIEEIVRRRMTVAHELGHLLLAMQKELTPKEKEKYCFRFAGAFLIPKEVLIYELVS